MEVPNNIHLNFKGLFMLLPPTHFLQNATLAVFSPNVREDLSLAWRTNAAPQPQASTPQ
jgi:hypothetical protein